LGTASTGTAISALSGAAAQKAAMAWIGRTFAGFAGGSSESRGNTHQRRRSHRCNANTSCCTTYNVYTRSCELLYEIRGKSVELIKLVQEVVNSIANTPKQFDTELQQASSHEFLMLPFSNYC